MAEILNNENFEKETANGIVLIDFYFWVLLILKYVADGIRTKVLKRVFVNNC